ncbi:MAG TPA: hypothetical protein VF220_03765 [Nitrososphaeraceae archaeon]
MSNQNTTQTKTLKEMIDSINVMRKEDMEFHKFQVGVGLRLIFPEPQEGINIIQTEIASQDGKTYPVVQFKDVVDIEDTTQKPKPLNIGKGASNKRLLERLKLWLLEQKKLNLEITKIDMGKKGQYNEYDYEIFPIE